MAAKPIRIGINGFGRIGRCAFKQMIDLDGIEVVGINDLGAIEDLAYLLKYDSVHHWYPRKVADDGSALLVDDHTIPFSSEKDPANIPWGKLGAQIVLECTGALRAREQASRHLDAGADRVIVSAPSDDADAMFVYGVNHQLYDPASHQVVSSASCTTNCLAPLVKVLHDSFGVENVMMTTVHAYTSSQTLVDTPARKRRRGRAGALSIIPTTTGAAKATEKVLPELEGRIDGMAMRVPVPDGSVVDAVARLSSKVTVEAVNEAFEKAADEPPLQGVLRVADEAVVSVDILGDPYSSIIDKLSTMTLGERTVKVLSWYDNEWGYAARLVDLAAYMTARE